MGELVDLQQQRRRRRPEGRPSCLGEGPVTFWFDLASPQTYLAAERVERRFAGVRWVPVVEGAVTRAAMPAGTRTDAQRATLARRAAVLGMPLVWPDPVAEPARAAMRLAAYAASCGRDRAAAYVLAAGRLAFCGGYDIDDPEILAEAAAAAGLPLTGALRAATDRTLDGPLKAAGRALLARGATELPVLGVGPTLFCGEYRLAEAEAATRARALAPGALAR